MTKEFLKHCIEQGAGRQPADIVLKGGRWFDLVTGQLRSSDVAISGDRIVGVGADYIGGVEIDISGQIIVPGFIDTHLHVESSLVTPYEFDRCVLRHGVTTAICDPHEISNVLGIEGLKYFLDCSLHTIMDLRVQLSSCVPATHLETSGARLDANDLAPFMDHPQVIGLAEFMNFPGVISADKQCLDKLALFEGQHIDGHAPLVRGLDLNAYLAAGIRTDHETTTADEALEKLSKGMQILIREGSVSKDLHALVPIMTERHSPHIALCTDDRNPLDIAEEGHLDFMIREAIAHGADVLATYRAASISAARIFGLQDRGLVAPGWRADLCVIDGLETCRVSHVFSAGRLVSDDVFANRKIVPPVGRNSVHVKPISATRLVARGSGKQAHVMGVDQGKIITQHLRRDLPSDNGVVRCDVEQGIAKVAVIERHGINGNLGLGFVHGFGLKAGAIASTVGHDSHNICVVGMNDDDMAAACNRLREIEGGFVVVRDGAVLAEMPLPIAGLMSLEPFETVRDQLLPLRAAAKSLGTTLLEPFLQVAFLPLPVIPHLKISDLGMVDVDKFELIEAPFGK
jgi:adenine deaminase